MAEYQVPLSYTINISLSGVPSGLADFNTNSIAVFTHEKPSFSESYQAYITPSAVASDFGSDSLTYKMATALFTPVPNFRTGGGMLYIFPYSATDATSTSFTTTDMSVNIENFQAVTDGTINLKIDGVDTEVTGLNFSTVKTVKDIVTILNSAKLDVYIEEVENKIKITSKRFGEDSTLLVGKASTGTDLFNTTLLNGDGATFTVGVNATGTKLKDAVVKAHQEVYFGGVLTTQFTENALTQENAQTIQSMDLDYFDVIASMKNMSVLGKALKEAGLGKTRTLEYSMDKTQSKVAIATYCTIAKSVNYSGTDTSNTLNLKTLTGVSPDYGLSDTYVLSAETNGVDIYGNTGGLSVVYSNDNNGYTDEIEADLWLKKKLEVLGFNYLRQTNTKIPQTEAGMTGLKSAYEQACIMGVRNGSYAPGTWNTAIPFGDPETFKEQIEQKGYYIYSIPVAEQAQTEREARKAPIVQIALKRAGAIHSSDVIVTITR